MIDMTQWAGKIHWLILFFVGGILMFTFPRQILGWALPFLRTLRDVLYGKREVIYPTRDKAPNWANFTAQDETGEWRWHREYPTFKNGYWSSLSPIGTNHAGFSKPINYGNSVLSKVDLDNINWEEWNSQKKI